MQCIRLRPKSSGGYPEHGRMKQLNSKYDFLHVYVHPTYQRPPPLPLRSTSTSQQLREIKIRGLRRGPKADRKSHFGWQPCSSDMYCPINLRVEIADAGTLLRQI